MEKILTVCGPIDPAALGVTSAHEHVFADLREHWVEPNTALAAGAADAPVTMDLLATLRRFPFSTTRDNLALVDEDLAVAELARFARVGGSAVVDLTSIGLKREPLGLYRTARATGLHIVMGGGCYVERAHPDWVGTAEIDELARRFADDVLVGAEGTRIRSGVIGEIGLSGIRKGTTTKDGHMTEAERRVLRAAGRAAASVGCGVSVHVDLRSRGGHEALDVLGEEGLPPDRVHLCHMDFVEDPSYHRELAERGAYVGFDSFGREYYQDLSGISWSNDRARIDLIAQLAEAGFSQRILVGHDVCMKMDLVAYGGNGYAHIPTAIVDRMRMRGIDEETIYAILVENPRRFLTIDFDEPTLEAIERDYRLLGGHYAWAMRSGTG